ncbi:MAG: glycosyltransferase [Gillisia sp.]
MIAEQIKLPSSAKAEKLNLVKHTPQQETTFSETGREQASDNNYRSATFTKRHHFTLGMTFLLLIGGAFSVYLLQPQFEEMNLSRMDTLGGMILVIVGSFLLLFRLGFLAYIARLFFKYKPVTSVSDAELPSCTVIVPAYNEGKLVYATLKSLTNSLYPEAKLQLIAIDDGSKDDTWEWMKKAKAELGDRVSIYQQPSNQGKRHALYRGFNLGTGDVFVTVDSDSIVENDTLRNLVSPFITNKDCGAVAGNVRVLNNEKAIIPRMLNVSFVFSFEFIRSAQSVLGSVLCTPGALAAYRRNAVMNCLPEWINQTFMGKPTDIGEDRAMTNMILKQGFHVLFQRNAYVLTNIPEKYSSLHKMFTRWERSNVRENLMMSKFAFTPFRNGAKSGTRLLLLNQWMGMITAYPLLLIMFFLLISQPVLFISSTLLSILIFSTLPAFFYAKKYNISEAFWAYSYSIFYTFSLFWITPYAMATASKRGWLTRELPVNK